MAQDITLNVAGKPYRLSAATPEMEQLMRVAAQEVSDMLTRFDSRFPESNPEDKLVFVAQKKIARLAEEVDSLGADVAAYLEALKK